MVCEATLSPDRKCPDHQHEGCHLHLRSVCTAGTKQGNQHPESSGQLRLLAHLQAPDEGFWRVWVWHTKHWRKILWELQCKDYSKRYVVCPPQLAGPRRQSLYQSQSFAFWHGLCCAVCFDKRAHHPSGHFGDLSQIGVPCSLKLSIHCSSHLCSEDWDSVWSSQGLVHSYPKVDNSSNNRQSLERSPRVMSPLGGRTLTC